jgi:hypothetical protein
METRATGRAETRATGRAGPLRVQPTDASAHGRRWTAGRAGSDGASRLPWPARTHSMRTPLQHQDTPAPAPPAANHPRPNHPVPPTPSQA